MKPMLAGTIKDLADLSFPVVASPKLDGVRALVVDGQLMSRNMKAIPNAYAQGLFGHSRFNGLDGELIIGDPCSPTAFRDTSSAVMSRDGMPDVRFWVFDDYASEYEGFHVRRKLMLQRIKGIRGFMEVPHHTLNTVEQVEQYEQDALAIGYEGVMLRDPAGAYKHGRSTVNEGGLLKLKRFADCEAMIQGYDEQLHNANEKKADGKRSSHKAGKVAKGTLGALKVIGINGDYKGIQFDVGTGFTDEERSNIWSRRERLHGQIVKVKYFPSGSKDKPRFPTFLGFRDLSDF